MKLSDDEVVAVLRAELSAWAEERPVADPDLGMLHARAPLPLDRPNGTSLRRRRQVRLVAAALVLVAAVVAVTVTVVRRDEPTMTIDVGPGTANTEIPVGRSFGVRGLAVADDAVWVTSAFDEELYRVDPATNQVVDTFPIPSHVEGVRAVGDWLWLSRYEPNEVIRVDPTTGALLDRFGFDTQPGLVSDGDRLWMLGERDGTGHAVEVDLETATEIDDIALDAPPGPAVVDGGALWVGHRGTTSVSRIDLADGRSTAVVDVGAEPRSLVAAAGSIWVAANIPANEAGDTAAGSLVRIDPASAEVTASVTTGRRVHALAADDDGRLWATNFDDGTISVVDARTGAALATSPIGNRPGGVAAGHGSIWVTPHRRNTLVRIDPTRPLEPAATPALTRSVTLPTGTTFVRCSGSGSPTVVLPGNTGEGAAWAVVEARLARRTRVCAYEPVGVADPTEADQAGPAATAAEDLATTLRAVDEQGPFVLVGEWGGALDAMLFTATHSEDVAGLLLVNPMSADYLDRVRAVLPTEARDRMDQAIREQPELQRLVESSRQAAAIDSFGDLPLVVLSDAPDVAVLPAFYDPELTVAESEAIVQLLVATRSELAELSTAGRLTVADGQVVPADIVAAALPLLD